MLPLIIMVSTSLKSYTEINTYPPTFLPNQIFPSNYVEAWNYKNTQFPRWTFNTIFIVVATVPGVVVTASLCAYGFARLKFPGRNIWFILVLASLMLPSQVTLIPLYILFYKIGWLNTFAPLIVPAWFGGGAINIFLLRQFFMQIPRELDEAAIIDGAGHLNHLVAHLYAAGTTGAHFSHIAHRFGIWNDFLGPFIYLSPIRIITRWRWVMNVFRNIFPSGIPRTDYIMSISTLMVLPMVLMFLLAQRYIVQGFVTSGIKG